MNTTIAISTQTRDLLKNIGKKSENYDDIIKRMYNILMLQEKMREFFDENEYSSLEEAKQWTNMQIKLLKK